MTTLSLRHPPRPSAAALLLLAFACNGSDLASPSTGEAPGSVPPTESPQTQPPSPRMIAFVSDRAGSDNTEIYAMDPTGTVVTRLTSSSGRDDDPAGHPTAERLPS